MVRRPGPSVDALEISQEIAGLDRIVEDGVLRGVGLIDALGRFDIALRDRTVCASQPVLDGFTGLESRDGRIVSTYERHAYIRRRLSGIPRQSTLRSGDIPKQQRFVRPPRWSTGVERLPRVVPYLGDPVDQLVFGARLGVATPPAEGDDLHRY